MQAANSRLRRDLRHATMPQLVAVDAVLRAGSAVAELGTLRQPPESPARLPAAAPMT